MTTLLLEPFGGMAGDMFLAALLDLGDPRFTIQELTTLAAGLVGDEASLSASETHRGGLRATHLDVAARADATPPHRHLSDLLGLLDRVPLEDAVRERAARVLRRLGEAEARVHGVPIESVHFHEVGAADTIIDIVGAAQALSRLTVTRVVATPPLVGDGTVTCAHGELPVPAPATAVLLSGVPQRRGGGGERLTPTAAALLAELVDEWTPSEVLTVDRWGYGAGTRDPAEGPPNLVRVGLAREESPGLGATRTAWLLEVTLDDVTGEEVGFVLESLYAAGALEAWTHPVTMKKGRPGVVLSALCRAEARRGLEEVVFGQTPTLGVRWASRQRTESARTELEVQLAGEPVRVKVRLLGGADPGPEAFSPEFDDLARIARRLSRPLRALEHEAIALAVRAWAARER